jgi:HSP20 family protein
MNDTCCTTSCTPVTGTATTMKPRFSVSSTAEAHTVAVDLPGVPKSGVTVSMERDLLTIQATGRPAVPDTWRRLHQELSPADYVLRLRIAAPVDDTQITATHTDGVLTLVLPVKEAAKPRRIELN